MPHQVGGRELGSGRSDHMAAVAEDGRPVAQVEHFFEPMAHEENGHAAVTSLTDDAAKTGPLS